MRNLRLLIAVLLAGGLVTGPALARHHHHAANVAMNTQRNVGATNPLSDATTAAAPATTGAAGYTNNTALVDADQLLQNASGVITNMQSDSSLVNLMSRAKAVFIVPNSGSTASGGVLLTSKNGRWSNPVFFSMGGGVPGAQTTASNTTVNGGAANNGPVALLIMSNRAMSRFESGGNFSITPSAKLNIVNYSPNSQQAPQAQQQTPQGQQPAQASPAKSDIVLWSGNNGANTAAAPSFTQISANKLYNQTVYGTANMHQILAGRAPLTNQLAVNLSTTLPANQSSNQIGTNQMRTATRPG